MSTTTLEALDNLYAQLQEDPGNHQLRGMVYDLFLDAGRETDAIELEARCWLKAKGRKAGSGGRFFYANFPLNHNQENFYGWLMDLSISNWIPAFLRDRKAALVKEIFADAKWAEESTIEIFIERWNRLEQEWKDFLWSWEPPK